MEDAGQTGFGALWQLTEIYLRQERREQSTAATVHRMMAVAVTLQQILALWWSRSLVVVVGFFGKAALQENRELQTGETRNLVGRHNGDSIEGRHWSSMHGGNS